MSKKISIEQMRDTIMDSLLDYDEAAAEDIKQAVRETAEVVRDEIEQTAPRDTGAYAKSWAVKKQKESPKVLSVVVHSKNRYQLTHLLEFGHAKRGGGRVAARPHIAKAEEHGIELLEDKLCATLGR